MTSILGTQTDLVDTLNEKYLEDEGLFRRKADKRRHERESKGQASMYSCLQPFNRPEISDLLHERIDLKWVFKVDGEDAPRWCQGEVIEVLKNARQLTVKMRFDPMPDVKCNEDYTVETQKLLPTLWNKDKKGAWRMDVDIDIEDDIDEGSENELEESDDETESECEDSESELESDSSNNDSDKD